MPTSRAFVLTDLPESSEEWHNKQIATIVARLSGKAQICEKQENGFEDIVGTFEEPLMTIYDFPETTDLTTLEQNFRIEENSTSPPKGARFNARFAEEIRRFESADYANQKSQVKIHIVTYFRPRKEIAAETLAWLYAEVYPILLNDPNLISVLVYKTTQAALFVDGVRQNADFDEDCDFISVFEMVSDDLPWEALVIMGQSEGWKKYFDENTRWCGVQFGIRKTFPEDLNSADANKTESLVEEKPTVNGAANGAINGHVTAEAAQPVQ